MGLIQDEGWSSVAKDPSQKKTFWACWLSINKERGFSPFLSSMTLHSPLNRVVAASEGRKSRGQNISC